MIRPIRKILQLRHSLNVWLWRKGLATRKQSYQLDYPLPHQKFTQSSHKGRYLLIGFCLGLIPYIVHMQGWLR